LPLLHGAEDLGRDDFSRPNGAPGIDRMSLVYDGASHRAHFDQSLG
jgi:hypothetical protein